MINKIYKSIHNKYSKIFKFFFFLRYVFAIFIISTSLFISVPKFFDYEKKQEIIKNYLSEHYDLEIVDHKLIEFKIFPLPNLSGVHQITNAMTAILTLLKLQIPKKNICDGIKYAYWPARLEKINHGKL